MRKFDGAKPVEAGTYQGPRVFPCDNHKELLMLKGGALWMLGIPLPIILILWFLGYL